ncbi:BUD31 [Hepatospora eriocheir]|uniref:BUD31 n=1 Tax=Hepatospora eriocheir TaxID=1081669 RepID=A0A1X0QEB4_9MICR|nr:BUD31 [Hepatospora eriocheir]
MFQKKNELNKFIDDIDKELKSLLCRKENVREELKEILRLTTFKTKRVFQWYNGGFISESDYKKLINENKISKDLINQWKINGYQKLCCIRCIINNKEDKDKVCICRIPSECLKKIESFTECNYCGCRGCS